MKFPLVIAPGGHLVLTLRPIALGLEKRIHKNGVIDRIVRSTRTAICKPYKLKLDKRKLLVEYCIKNKVTYKGTWSWIVLQLCVEVRRSALHNFCAVQQKVGQLLPFLSGEVLQEPKVAGSSPT